jgi:hypothetical protein
MPEDSTKMHPLSVTPKGRYFEHIVSNEREDCPRHLGLNKHGGNYEQADISGSADQRISGGWCSHGGAEARREQREETATRRPGGQLARPVLLPVVLEPPWLPTGISTRALVIHPVRVHK